MNTEIIIGAFQRMLHKQLVEELQSWLPPSDKALSIDTFESSEPYRKAVALLLVADGLENDTKGLPRSQATEFSLFADKLADALEADEFSDEIAQQLSGYAKMALDLIEDSFEFGPELLELVELGKDFFDLN